MTSDSFLSNLHKELRQGRPFLWSEMTLSVKEGKHASSASSTTVEDTRTEQRNPSIKMSAPEQTLYTEAKSKASEWESKRDGDEASALTQLIAIPPPRRWVMMQTTHNLQWATNSTLLHV